MNENDETRNCSLMQRVFGIRQSGRDLVACSGCAEQDRGVVAVTKPRATMLSRLVGDGPWRAWCADCWPHRCPGTVDDTSVRLLDAPYAGTWVGLHAVMDAPDETRDDLDDQAVPCRCDCPCPDCTTETVRHDGWRYLWVGRWFLAVHVDRRAIALSAGREAE